jgi:hypothetical protein
MIRDQETGYLIPYDADEMYRSMKLFLTDENLISEIKENLKDIESQFDNQKIFESIENIILQLIEK